MNEDYFEKAKSSNSSNLSKNWCTNFLSSSLNLTQMKKQIVKQKYSGACSRSQTIYFQQ